MSYLYEIYDYSLFESRFKDYNRLDQFSLCALRALFNELVDRAEGSGEPIEVDVISLCCNYAELTPREFAHENGTDDIEVLRDETWIIKLDNGNILYEVF